MQQDAVRRVNEMRARARANLSDEPKKDVRNDQHIPQKENTLHKEKTKSIFAKKGNPLFSKENPLFSFIKDNEQLLVLLLIVMLMGEDCDEGLLIALLYICM